MAEAFNVNQKISSKILFTTTLISIITIPLLALLKQYIKLNLSERNTCLMNIVKLYLDN